MCYVCPLVHAARPAFMRRNDTIRIMEGHYVLYACAYKVFICFVLALGCEHETMKLFPFPIRNQNIEISNPFGIGQFVCHVADVQYMS